MRMCPRCNKPEFASGPSDFCYEKDCYWKTCPPEKDSVAVQAEFISALEDAEIRQNCFQMVVLSMQGQGASFEDVLANTSILYDWIMGEEIQTIEEAAEPASVPTSEECEPKRH